MPDYAEAQKTKLEDLAAEDEKYLLRTRTEVVTVLRDLSKKANIITGYFHGGSRYLLTSVVDVLPDRDLLVIDTGRSEADNRAAVEHGELLCVTKVNHISIKFRIKGLQRAKYQGEHVFATPIPETLFRHQRREFFRVNTPVANPLLCRFQHPEAGELELPLSDIGGGGVALYDFDMERHYELFTLLKDCHMELEDIGPLDVDLEIRNCFPQTRADGKQIQHIGCRFVSLNHESEGRVQRYLHKLQLLLRGQ